MTVNGVNGAGQVSTAQAVKNLQARNIEITDDAIAQEMQRMRQANSQKGLEVEHNSEQTSKQKELTTDELIIKDMLINDPKLGIAGCKDQAQYTQLLQNLSAFPNLVKDPDVQAALKAKKVELNPPPAKPVAPKQTTFAHEVEFEKLQKAETSSEIIQLQIDAEKTKQKILAEVQTIDIESAKAHEAQHADVIQQFIDVAVYGQSIKTNAESLKNIAQTKLTDEQKGTLENDLNNIASMSLEDICKEVGITIDTSKLANLGEDVTIEQVEEQLGYVENLLAQMEGVDGKKSTGLAKVRADRAAADQNIANNNRMIAKYDRIRKDMIENGELTADEADPNAESILNIQEANLEALKVVAKADGALKSIAPLHTQLLQLQQQLHKSYVNLANIETFDDCAESYKRGQIVLEDRDLAYDKAQVQESTKKRDDAVKKMTTAKFKNDANLKALESSDKKANEKVDKKEAKYNKIRDELKEDIKYRDLSQKIVNDRELKQKELDKLRGEDEEELTP